MADLGQLKEVLVKWVARRAGTAWVYSGETPFISENADLPTGFVSVVKTGGTNSGAIARLWSEEGGSQEIGWGDAEDFLPEEYILSGEERESHSWLTLEIILKELNIGKAKKVMDMLRQMDIKFNERSQGDFYGGYSLYEMAIISFEQIGEVLGREISRDPKGWLGKLIGSSSKEVRLLGAEIAALGPNQLGATTQKSNGRPI